MTGKCRPPFRKRTTRSGKLARDLLNFGLEHQRERIRKRILSPLCL